MSLSTTGSGCNVTTLKVGYGLKKSSDFDTISEYQQGDWRRAVNDFTNLTYAADVEVAFIVFNCARNDYFTTFWWYKDSGWLLDGNDRSSPFTRNNRDSKLNLFLDISEETAKEHDGKIEGAFYRFMRDEKLQFLILSFPRPHAQGRRFILTLKNEPDNTLRASLDRWSPS